MVQRGNCEEGEEGSAVRHTRIRVEEAHESVFVPTDHDTLDASFPSCWRFEIVFAITVVSTTTTVVFHAHGNDSVDACGGRAVVCL